MGIKDVKAFFLTKKKFGRTIRADDIMKLRVYLVQHSQAQKPENVLQ